MIGRTVLKKTKVLAVKIPRTVMRFILGRRAD